MMHRPENDPGTIVDMIPAGSDMIPGPYMISGPEMIPAPAMIASPKRMEMCGVRNLVNRFKINIIFFFLSSLF